jgi:preprotein translocase subunit SecD
VIQGGFTNDSANQLAALVGMSPLPIPVRLVEE